MGQAFSGPNAFKFFGFTQPATIILQKNPLFLVVLVAVLVVCISLGLLAWYIHYVTNIPYRKPKEVKGAKK
jgi:hypothetical protein